MNSVVKRIKSKYLKNIMIGKQKWILSKTLPNKRAGEMAKQESFKVFLYCEDSGEMIYKRKDDNTPLTSFQLTTDKPAYILNDRIVAEFTCNYVECWRPKGMVGSTIYNYDCGMNLSELITYAGTNKKLKDHLYAWKISDLKIYDIPKVLGSIKVEVLEEHTKAYNRYSTQALKKAPSDWQYVEYLSEEINTRIDCGE